MRHRSVRIAAAIAVVLGAVGVAVVGNATPAGATAPSFTSTVNGGSSATIASTANATLATVGLPVDATGTVDFSYGATLLCTATLTAGDGSCGTTGLTSGSYTGITATYSGDSAYDASDATNTVDLTVTGPTSFTSTVDGGSSATIASTANATLATVGLPGSATGTVEFHSGATLLCTATITTGDDSCDTTGLAAGDYTGITATYSGDSAYDASDATNTVDLTVTAATSFTSTVDGGTSSSISPSANATLATSGLPGDATGTVDFYSGATLLCTATITAGDDSCDTAGLTSGSYSGITATYSGDTAYDASDATNTVDLFVYTSTSFTITVNGGSSATITSSANATLALSGLNSRASGTIEFDQAGDVLCTATLPATSCDTSGLDVGDYSGITATYSGDSTYETSDATNTVDLTVADPTSSLFCNKVSGTITKKITFTNCGLSQKGGRIAGSAYLTGGDVTWALSKTGLTYSGSATSPGQGACPTGRVEQQFTGLVTAATAAFVSVGDLVSFDVCVNTTNGVVKLVHGTTADF